MQIGEIIRKERKRLNMTQEEMARRLGVTTPAVNKWENGNSLPDIMMLAPIARLLGITVDTLLDFQKELTREEISQLVQEVDMRLKNDTYEEAFRWAKEKLELYPNCEQLIWQMAVILDAWRLTKEIPGEKYDAYIRECYLRVLHSEDENMRTQAADSLFGYYVRNDQYEKAEEYLAYYSEQNPERKRKQALIYSKTDRIEEAYKAYEQLLFSGYQMLSMVLNSMYMLAMEGNNRGKAHMYVEKQQALSKTFEMSEYAQVSAMLDLAVAEKDVETTLDVMEKMIASIDTVCDFVKSPLYEHMNFSGPREEFLAEIKRNLMEQFRDEETFGFLKGNRRWAELTNSDCD